MKTRKMSTGKLVFVTLAFVVCISIAIIAIMVPLMGDKPPEQSNVAVPQTVDFPVMYQAYKENELRADETYQGNRYLVTAMISGMTNDGLLNVTGGATLTMQIKIDNTVVIFYAEFEKDQEEALKTVSVGDTITFEGECRDAGNWSKCVLQQS